MFIRPVVVACVLALSFSSASADDDPFISTASDPVEEPQAHVPVEEAAAADFLANDDVIEMVLAGLPDTTVIAAFRVNPTRFDVTPRALIALTQAGVSAQVIEAMMAHEQSARDVAATSQAMAPAEAVDESRPEPEPIPAPVEAAVAPPAVAMPVQPQENGGRPRAWLDPDGQRLAFAASTAQVAFMQSRQSGSALNTLQGIGERALAFANPALGLATGLGALFRSGDPTVTAVWALPGTQSARQLLPGTVLEIDFAGIPGINPDQYRPALVRVVATNDNFRLVGAARTRASSGGLPTGAIIEEAVPLEVTQLARGRYRVTLSDALTADEYAVVLRPVQPAQRERRRNNPDTSLGDLIGTQGTDILYVAWDFGVGPRSQAPSP
jgi:hypothetical protein